MEKIKFPQCKNFNHLVILERIYSFFFYLTVEKKDKKIPYFITLYDDFHTFPQWKTFYPHPLLKSNCGNLWKTILKPFIKRVYSCG